MTRSYALLAILVLSTSYAVGCGEDVGPCTDPNEGRDTVLNMERIEYAGQAIMNRSCATGCHSSTATGEGRRGAPAGLDFDLIPVSESEADGSRKRNGREIVKLSSDQLTVLWKRQRTVYDNRDLIWQQVRDGLMPPDGMFETFKEFAQGLYQSKETSPCTQGKQIKDLGSQKQVLRNWLACGAPIVESAGTMVKKMPTPGIVGYQYPSCGGGGPVLADEPVTLESLMKAQFASCAACHPLLDKEVSFQSLELARETMIDFPMEICNGKRYVEKGNPDESFLIDILTKVEPGCMHTRMPSFAAAFTKEQVKQVSDWIESGAPLTEDDVDAQPMEPEDDDDMPPEDPEPTMDAGPDDEEEDASAPVPSADAGTDAGRDAGRDAGADAGRDAGADAGRDAGRRFPF